MEYSLPPFIVYKKGDKGGIMNALKELIVPCIYPHLSISKIVDGLIYCEALIDADTDRLIEHYEFIFNEQGVMLLPELKTEFCVLKNGLITIENPTNSWGCVNRQGQLVIPCQYYQIRQTQNDNLLVCARNHKWGCIDRLGKVIIPCNYQTIKQTDKGFYVVQRAKKWYFISPEKVKSDSLYEKIEYLNPYWKAFYKGKWILLDDTGGIVNAIEYDEIRNQKCGNIDYIIVSQGKLTGLINALTAEMVFPIAYPSESIHTFYEERMVLRQNGLLGIIDKFKQYILPCQYNDIQRFKNLIMAQQDGLWGFWDLSGHCLLSCQFQNVISFEDDFIGVQHEGQWGLVTTSGQYIVKCQFDEIKSLETNCVQVRQLNQWGLVCLDKLHVTACQYDEIYNFKEGMARVRMDSKFGFINAQGELIVPAKYTEASDFKEGMAKVGRGKHIKYYGYVNLLGEEAIPLIYEYAHDFSEGLARVCYDECGFVDKKGNVKIPFIYEADYVGDFQYGIATAALAGHRPKMGAIDTENRMVLPFIYDMVWGFDDDGCTSIEHEGQYFIIDRTGFVYYEPD